MDKISNDMMDDLSSFPQYLFDSEPNGCLPSTDFFLSNDSTNLSLPNLSSFADNNYMNTNNHQIYNVDNVSFSDNEQIAMIPLQTENVNHTLNDNICTPYNPYNPFAKSQNNIFLETADQLQVDAKSVINKFVQSPPSNHHQFHYLHQEQSFDEIMVNQNNNNDNNDNNVSSVSFSDFVSNEAEEQELETHLIAPPLPSTLPRYPSHSVSVPPLFEKSKFYISDNENNDDYNEYNDDNQIGFDSFDSFYEFPPLFAPNFTDNHNLEKPPDSHHQIMAQHTTMIHDDDDNGPFSQKHHHKQIKHEIGDDKEENDEDYDLKIKKTKTKTKTATKSTAKNNKKSNKKSKQRKWKKASKSTPKKSKKARKRKIEEMDDDDNYDEDDDEFYEPSAQKRKFNEKDIEQYIDVTLTKKQCDKIYDKYISNGKILIDKTGNYCFINECNKTFKAKHHLKRHCYESHIGRKFICSFPGCSYSKNGKAFKQKTQTKEHIANTHFGSSSDWKCFLCDDKFTRYGGVKRHILLKRCKIIKNKTNLNDKEIAKIVQDAKDNKFRQRCKI